MIETIQIARLVLEISKLDGNGRSQVVLFPDGTENVIIFYQLYLIGLGIQIKTIIF